MLFNSWQFILAFLPITFGVYFYLNRARLTIAAKVWLVLANLFFYSFWNINYLALILTSMMFNFALGSSLGKESNSLIARISRKKTLFFGVAVNLIALGFFKYATFAVGNFNQIFNSSFPLPTIVLPLAISFFTFQQIAYLVDSYYQETKEYDFLNYALFVTFFPQLIAGPIVHHKEMMPQFASPKNLFIRYDNILQGLFIFGIGLFKKVAIADTFSTWVTAGFDSDKVLDFYAAWATSLSYTFQIYFDFSGYCDMAIGLALLFNIRLPLNFSSPYKALDIQDFWRRWHITLSRFLRNYLYIPLGGNKVSSSRTYCNLMTTFVLGGLWHGATWMFVLWGALHGAGLIIHRLWQKLGYKLPKPISWLLTFLFINFAWIFFRAETSERAITILKGMFNFGTKTTTPQRIPIESLAWGGTLSDYILKVIPHAAIPYLGTYCAITASMLLISQKNTYELMCSRLHTGKFVAGVLIFSIGMYTMFASTSTEFLYFNF